MIHRIEAVVQRDVGRGMQPIFHAARGGLWSAAAALASAPSPRIGVITGFFVPNGDPPAAETDGPAGAALLARAFLRAGLHCRIATDTVCRSATQAALDAADTHSIQLDAIAPEADPTSIVELWRSDRINWVVAIERCGPSADGRPHNMRGADISQWVAPLDRVFSAGPWRTIAIGDGGNEIGMGRIPRVLIEEHVPHGARIGCVVPADHLIAAGVSHWGAYALLSALAVLRPDWATLMLDALDPALDARVVDAMVRLGPAVDGVSLRRETSIDARGMDVHHASLAEIKQELTRSGFG